MAQSVTRRGALKKFGVGLAGMALATFGLADKAGASPPKRSQGFCAIRRPSLFSYGGSAVYTGMCMDIGSCVSYASADCPANGTVEGNTQGNEFACGFEGIFLVKDLAVGTDGILALLAETGHKPEENVLTID